VQVASSTERFLGEAPSETVLAEVLRESGPRFHRKPCCGFATRGSTDKTSRAKLAYGSDVGSSEGATGYRRGCQARSAARDLSA
jgi:hypothetical protein